MTDPTFVMRVEGDLVDALRGQDDAWLQLVDRLGFKVRRSREAWVSYADETIQISPDDALDPDDTLAQILFHELCHWLTEGEDARYRDDWGLDNLTDTDLIREHAAIVVQAHWAAQHGLRDALVPTTDFYAFFETLGGDPFDAGEAGTIGRAVWARIQGSAAFAAIDAELARLRTALDTP